ncbi:MAG TPA: T9SS type A sorting domain-containing protein, partial [Ferruginibacter sp.]|nr:T9SS type A sorting domain-containing protein [Ferruginibacter sp.]
ISGTVTLTAGTMVLGNVSALGTTAVPLVLNGGTLDLATDASVNAYNVTLSNTVTISSNRATSGAGITHTLGTLSIGTGDQLNVVAGSNVPAADGALTFGATTLSGATPLFDVAFDVNLTLGALSGNFAFTKQGNGLMTLNTASARTGGTVTINTGSIRLGNVSALGTAAVPVVMNAGSGLNLATDATVNAHNVTVNGDASIFSNRATSGAGITHTLGTLSIGNSRLTIYYGNNVNNVTAGITFGTTTMTAATPIFDVSSGGVTLTLGALTGNVAFNKDGGGRLALNTASARTGGTVTLLDGTISLGATNALGTTAVPLQLNGGVLDLATATTVNAYNTTVGGNTIIASNKNAAGAGITHVLGNLSIGAFTVNVNQGANVTGGTAAVQFGNLTMTGAPVLSTNTANVIFTGTASGAFKLTKSGAATLQKTTAAWTLGSDFEITAGTYDATTQNTTLLGNWINNGGTHTASGASTVSFNGAAAQTIGGSASTTFNNLTINNANGVSIANNETVNAALTLTDGNLIVPTGNTLTIANGNTIGGSGFSAAKSIVTQVNTVSGAKGFVRVNNMAAAAYLLPVSDGTYYLPVTLTPTDVVANNSFSVCVFPGITEDGEPNGVPFSANQKNRCVDAVWTVNYNGPGTPTAASTTMKVEWPEVLEGAFFSGLGDNLIGIAHYGPSWGPCQAALLTGNNTTNTVALDNITQFSPFGVGWIDPSGGVLAIKINYFNASKGNGFNTLNWQASCSSAQAIFELERSVDGVNFININSITASQARCASPFSYNDMTAPSGTVYYRIRIIDVDGKASYSAIVKLSNQVKGIELSGIAPNPVMNTAQVRVNTTKKDVVNLVISSADGKVVYRNTVQLQAGASIINVDISQLPSGVYMLKGLFTDGQTNTVKFIKQ